MSSVSLAVGPAGKPHCQLREVTFSQYTQTLQKPQDEVTVHCRKAYLDRQDEAESSFGHVLVRRSSDLQPLPSQPRCCRLVGGGKPNLLSGPFLTMDDDLGWLLFAPAPESHDSEDELAWLQLNAQGDRPQVI